MDIQAQIKDFRVRGNTCDGSSCMDIAMEVISMMGYVNVLAAQARQEAHALMVTEMVNESAAKAEAIMKASDEYKNYLTYNGYSECLMELSRTLRAKGKLSEEEKNETYGN